MICVLRLGLPAVFVAVSLAINRTDNYGRISDHL